MLSEIQICIMHIVFSRSVNFSEWPCFEHKMSNFQSNILRIKLESPGMQIVTINTIMQEINKIWMSLIGILVICNKKF